MASKVDVLKTLRAARKLLTPRENWTTNVYSRRSPKSQVSYFGNDPRATCWCMVGAFQKVLDTTEGLDRIASLFDFSYEGSMTDFNDSHTHEEVLAAFDAAIAKAEASHA